MGVRVRVWHMGLRVKGGDGELVIDCPHLSSFDVYLAIGLSTALFIPLNYVYLLIDIKYI